MKAAAVQRTDIKCAFMPINITETKPIGLCIPVPAYVYICKKMTGDGTQGNTMPICIHVLPPPSAPSIRPHQTASNHIRPCLQTRDHNFNKMLSYRRETALQGAL